MTLKTQLLTLAADWRNKAKDVEDRFQPIVPAQSHVAVTALNNCAEELEELANAQPD